MRKTAQLGVLILLTAISTFATTVTGTITDQNGNAYVNGTESAQLSVGTGQNPGTPTIVTTNSSGAFSMTLTPGSYVFTTCALPLNIGPTTNPTPKQVCFYNTTPIAIAGSSQDVSTTLNAIAAQLGPAISCSAGNTANTVVKTNIFGTGCTVSEIVDTGSIITSNGPHFFPGNGSNTRTFINPGLGLLNPNTAPYMFNDSSPDSTNSSANGDVHYLPYLNINLIASGTGVPIPAYFFINGGPNANQTDSNETGLFDGCNLPSGATDTGCWGAAEVVGLNNPGTDSQMFGHEVNMFENVSDPGPPYPTDGLTRSAKFGSTVTNSGTFPIQTAFLSTYTSTGNKPHVGMAIRDSINADFRAGLPANAGPDLTGVVGFAASELGVSTSGSPCKNSKQFEWLDNSYSSGANENSFTVQMVCTNNTSHRLAFSYNGGEFMSIDSNADINGNVTITGNNTYSGSNTVSGSFKGNDIPIPTSLTTTNATSDNVTVTGMTSGGHCSIAATNSSAASNITTTYISAKTTNQITVTHTATASMTYDILCTPN